MDGATTERMTRWLGGVAPRPDARTASKLPEREKLKRWAETGLADEMQFKVMSDIAMTEDGVLTNESVKDTGIYDATRSFLDQFEGYWHVYDMNDVFTAFTMWIFNWPFCPR